MVANSTIDIKARLKETMAERRVRVPLFSEQTGIPKDRVYAWFRDNTKPKAEDQARIEKWISGEISINNEENVSRGTYLKPADPIQIIAQLVENNSILTRNNEKLVNHVLSLSETGEAYGLSSEVSIDRRHGVQQGASLDKSKTHSASKKAKQKGIGQTVGR